MENRAAGVSAEPPWVEVWDVVTGTKARALPDAVAGSLAVAADGKMLTDLSQMDAPGASAATPSAEVTPSEERL
jgi:hypothetical protein